MSSLKGVLFTILLFSWISRLSAGVSIPSDPLANLIKVHPRLLASAADFAHLKLIITRDPVAQKMAAAVIRKADTMLNLPLPQHVLPDGKRLLATSRSVRDRMQALGMAWQLTGDPKYPTRAWKDLEAAGNFPDWNPPHFLDTAEMTAAFGVGLDWMYDAWTPVQREQICQWILKLGIAPAMAGYKNPNSLNGKQLRSLNNWGQVTNGGIGVGALAIADAHPEEARAALKFALECVQPSLSSYAPDGGTGEGYGYYIYGMEYSVCLISSLDASVGTDFGLDSLPGFQSTPDFPTYLEGPNGTYFGFSDCGEGEKKVSSIPSAGWVANHFGNSIAAANQRAKASQMPSALGLLWLPPPQDLSQANPSSRVKAFVANACCTLRTAWNDPLAGFVGFKGGQGKVSHGHLDAGSFVYDVGGGHWAVDLGADNYNLPDYFGKLRWNYYRLRAEGNNTLVVNPDKGPDQNPDGNCTLTLCADRGPECVAIADLTPAYPMLASAKRGVWLANDGSLRVQDELKSGSKDANVIWFMHTPAKIEIGSDGKTATLSAGGKILEARLVSPSDSVFQALSPVPLPTSPNPPGQNANAKITKLVIRAICKSNIAIIVDFSQKGAPDKQSSPIKPLAGW